MRFLVFLLAALPCAALAQGAPPPSAPLPIDPAVVRDTIIVLQQQIAEKCGGMVNVVQRLDAARSAVAAHDAPGTVKLPGQEGITPK